MTAIGILSAAHVHTDAYAGILAAMDGVDLVGVADDDPDRGRAAAERHGTAYRDPDDLLAAADGAVVCSTNERHARWIEAAADAGVDVLCEKPLATTTDAADEILDVVNDAGIDLGLAMPLRFSEPVKEARDALAADEVGEVHTLSGGNRGHMPGGWFVDPDEAGGGAVMDHTVHVVDVVHWLLDERVVEVYAETGTRMHDIPVEDVNVLSMELEDGTQFLLDGSWSRPDTWHTWGDAFLEITGEDGVVSVDCFDQTLAYTSASGDDAGVNSLFWGDDPNRGLVADFVDAVETGREPMISGEEGRAAVAVVEAAYRSSERGEPVPVEH